MEGTGTGRTRLVFEVAIDVPEANEPFSVDSLTVEEALRHGLDRVVHDPVQDINAQLVREVAGG